jgi:hypothetical protein
MSDKDVQKQIQDVRKRCVGHEEVQRLAVDAGWVFDRWGKGHAIYIKPGFPMNLSIPQHKELKRGTVRRLLSIIESSVYREEEEE